MRECISIGPVPAEENCQQVGMPEYDAIVARKECERFIRHIRAAIGNEPEGASLKIKSNPHDFGNYLDVVCYFDDMNDEAANYAYRAESNEVPSRWIVWD